MKLTVVLVIFALGVGAHAGPLGLSSGGYFESYLKTVVNEISLSLSGYHVQANGCDTFVFEGGFNLGYTCELVFTPNKGEMETNEAIPVSVVFTPKVDTSGEIIGFDFDTSAFDSIRGGLPEGDYFASPFIRFRDAVKSGLKTIKDKLDNIVTTHGPLAKTFILDKVRMIKESKLICMTGGMICNFVAPGIGGVVCTGVGTGFGHLCDQFLTRIG